MAPSSCVETVKYQVGDLIDDRDLGLGYISNITQDGFGLYINWFIYEVSYEYTSIENIERWIMNRTTKHYPVVKQ